MNTIGLCNILNHHARCVNYNFEQFSGSIKFLVLVKSIRNGDI